MGRILTIRLTALTHNEAEVFSTWPKMCALAWPGQGEIVNGSWRRSVVPVALQPPQGVETRKSGVVELADALADQERFGAWLPDQKELLHEALTRLAAARKELEAALADWKPQEAHKASIAMEDALDDMERVLE